MEKLVKLEDNVVKLEKPEKTSVRCRNEQRVNIKFCVKLGITPSETYHMLKEAYGDSCMSKVSTVEWHRKFRKGREDVTDSPRTGRPTRQSEENIKKVNDMLLMDQTLSNQQIAKQLNVSRETIRRIRSEHLKMKRNKPKKTNLEKKPDVVPSVITTTNALITTINQPTNGEMLYIDTQAW